MQHETWNMNMLWNNEENGNMTHEQWTTKMTIETLKHKETTNEKWKIIYDKWNMNITKNA